MLSPKTQFSVGDAKKYFREHLCVGDYYTEGQQVPGHWFGKGAEDLGLPRLQSLWIGQITTEQKASLQNLARNSASAPAAACISV